jgi:hypothetical protein
LKAWDSAVPPGVFPTALCVQFLTYRLFYRVTTGLFMGGHLSFDSEGLAECYLWRCFGRLGDGCSAV